jgi:hypothetical protein
MEHILPPRAAQPRRHGPGERLDTGELRGLTEAQRAMLHTLGAYEVAGD